MSESENKVVAITPSERLVDFDHVVTMECLGACSLLTQLPEDKRMGLLEECAKTQKVWCIGPRDGQRPNAICRQPDATKVVMRRQIGKQ